MRDLLPRSPKRQGAAQRCARCQQSDGPARCLRHRTGPLIGMEVPTVSDGPTAAAAPDDSAAFFERYAELAGHLRMAIWWGEAEPERPGEEAIIAGWCQHNWSRVAEDCAQLAAVASRLADAVVACGQQDHVAEVSLHVAAALQLPLQAAPR